MISSELILAPLAAAALYAQCGIQVSPSPDYRSMVATMPEGMTATQYRWIRNGQEWKPGIVPRTVLLDAGQPTGPRVLAREGLLNPDEGAVEMWISARQDGGAAVYTKDNVLLRYASGADTFTISQSGRDGTLYLGGTVRGQWESAYSGRASMRAWPAGARHHIAATWSASENFMRFYVDGVKAADTNEHHYWAPDISADRFTINDSVFQIDAVRFSFRAIGPDEARADAQRPEPPRRDEVWLTLEDIGPGESLAFDAAGCVSAAFVYQGIPITDPQPASTLLAPGTTEVQLSVHSAAPAACRYAVNVKAAFEDMTPFDSGAGTLAHSTRVTGLSPDPTRVNEVFVRCSSAPEYAMRLIYRSLGTMNPPFPRLGNLWGSSNMLRNGYEYAAKVKGYFGAEMSPDDIRALRKLNPEILILTSINTVENSGLPEDYFLHDVNGAKIEVWPGTYRLNLTKPYVAEYQARFAYQKLLESELLYDGCFFDNFFTSQSWLKADIHGTPVQLDADEDGKPDDPAWLDAEWRKGVFHELEIWRALMPNAFATGHLAKPSPPELGAIFNGNSVLFTSTNVIDGKQPFADLWEAYQQWWDFGRKPVITELESSPMNQIAYGYGYSPFRDAPASTIEFAKNYFQYMRFGLAISLMNDGYYWHDFGDIVHGVDWPYDEYGFDLGYPTGPAALVDSGQGQAPNLLADGNWNLSLAAGVSATLARDGAASAITITNAGQGVNWHVDFNQRDRSLTKGVSYDLSFLAKADVNRDISLGSQKGAPDWRNYGLSRTVSITTEWQRYTVTFEANETVNDSRIQFFLGGRAGKVWLDDVRLTVHPPQIYRRYFTKGAALLNGTSQRITVNMPEGYSRFSGTQAPKYQYILDDDAAGFAATGNWTQAVFDTGQWKSRGPYFHNWGKSCRKLAGNDGSAQWDLGIREDGVYTIEAWWAAAPEQSTWTKQAVYEVVADGRVIAAKSLDQSASGDQWHLVGEVPLSANAHPIVRVRNQGDGALIADALHVRSAARYNDGSPASQFTLEPYDGILLTRSEGKP